MSFSTTPITRDAAEIKIIAIPYAADRCDLYNEVVYIPGVAVIPRETAHRSLWSTNLQTLSPFESRPVTATKLEKDIGQVRLS